MYNICVRNKVNIKVTKNMKKLWKCQNLVITLLVVLVIALLALPCGAYIYHGSMDYVSNGFQMIFGRKDGDYYIFKINVFGIVILIILLASLIIPWLNKYLGKYRLLLESFLVLLAANGYLVLPITVNHARLQINEKFHGLLILYLGALILVLAAAISITLFIYSYKKEKQSILSDEENSQTSQQT